MLEEIIKNNLYGATHWRNGSYYFKSDDGIWFELRGDKWWSCMYKVDAVAIGMIKLPRTNKTAMPIPPEPTNKPKLQTIGEIDQVSDFWFNKFMWLIIAITFFALGYLIK